MVNDLSKEDTAITAVPVSNKVSKTDLKVFGIVEAYTLMDQVWGFEGLLIQMEKEPGSNDGEQIFGLFSTHSYTHSARVDSDASGTHIYLYGYCPNDGARAEFTDYLEALRNAE